MAENTSKIQLMLRKHISPAEAEIVEQLLRKEIAEEVRFKTDKTSVQWEGVFDPPYFKGIKDAVNIIENG